ncbi:MAG: CBS domain-containing protein [Sphingomonas sp.]|uniref:CBS domain-containing protein n=1 Tax=unclassified Sphingomonas TaxID=196159 RepID=UPI0024548F45|nr:MULTISPECIES: CBS domain-containing protein [unclassified Sphingomonas]MBQ1498539.1 CBS domain-containing protein [Sphingomonas sp.]MDH4744819.1 CBS domain-containing protein [Sphingomonas sp. CBMAI 2297]
MTIAAILGGKGHEVVSIDGDRTVADAVALLAGKRIGAVPVMSGGAVAGIFSERDVIYCLEREGAAALARKVGDVMTAPAITVSPDESVLAALALMTRRRIRHLPVVEGDTCIGLVSIGDLVKYRIERIESEADAMRAYIQAV